MRKLLAAALLLFAALAVGAAQGALPSGNLVVNGGAEDGTAGWTTSGSFTVERYAAVQPGRGANFFSGGSQPPSSATQTIDLRPARKLIDAGRIDARVSALTSGPATLTITTTDARDHTLSSLNVLDRDVIPIPPRARLATITMKARGPDATFDNVAFTLVRRALPRPEHGKSVLVKPAKGVTLLLRRGNRKTIARPTLVPVGSVLDTSHGTATIVSAEDRFGMETGGGSFSQAVFAVEQSGQYTKVALGGRGMRTCTAPRRIVSSASSDFVVLAGRMASRAANFSEGGTGHAVWVAQDLCTRARVEKHRGEVLQAQLRSRRASSGFTFRTLGRNSSATVRGKATSG